MRSEIVTARAAARHDGAPGSPAADLAGAAAVAGLVIRAADGRLLHVAEGQWVVEYAPGDLGVMDDGEYRRWFGGEPS